MQKNNRVVIITGPLFEDVEVIYPYYRLLEEDLQVDIVTSTNKPVVGKHGVPMVPTMEYEALRVDDFAMVIIPGGNEAPDRVRQVETIVSFVSGMYAAGKIVSSICHGPWVLIEAGIMKGKQATCYPGMKTDLINAGARYSSDGVVVDGTIVTGDHPRSMAKWMKETLRVLSEH